ncbi:MAG: response regulator [Microvirga sp.]
MIDLSLAGRRILLVEDEYFIADDMVGYFESRGADVVGPVASVRGALDLLASTQNLDAAVLDVNLLGELAYPVADALLERGVPFIFATGYDGAVIPSRYAAVHRCEKPVAPSHLAKVLFTAQPAQPPRGNSRPISR